MKKNIFSKVLALAAIALATSAFAIPKDPCVTEQPCCEEAAPGPFAFSYPKDLGLACPRDFYAQAEFLWMKGAEEGLEYAIDQDGGNPNIFPLTNGQLKGFSQGSQEWDWRPGFRVGFGFYSNHDAWNFEANWTYIRIKADSTGSNSGTGTLLPMFLPPTTFPAMTLANSHWTGDFNTMDLSIGKPYHVSRYFISNPMFGIRAAWIDQDYHVRYFMDGAKNNVLHKNDYWGVGLRGSYNAQFLLGSNCSLYGNAAFSLLYGKFDLSQNSEAPAIALGAANYKLEDSFYSVQPNAELGIGINWSKYFNKHQYMVSLKVGYEFHQWWDQNQIRRFFNANPVANDTVSRGDLSFNGFVFGLGFDF